jgi:outer membrane protein assembly factor BamB
MKHTKQIGLVVAISVAGWACVQTRSLAAQVADWPQFRGPGGLGISSATGLPLTWSADKNTVWTTELPGPGASSPITVDERIFVTCYSGYGADTEKPGNVADLKRHLLCLNRSDGERVCVFFGKSGVFAFDLDGRQVWHADIGSGTHEWGTGASPVIYRNLVIVNASIESESLIALDAHTGKEVWRADGIREAYNTPHFVEVPGGQTELVLAIRDWVLGFEPATGKLLWRCEVPNKHNNNPRVVAHNGIVYCIVSGPARSVLAVRAGGREAVLRLASQRDVCPARQAQVRTPGAERPWRGERLQRQSGRQPRSVAAALRPFSVLRRPAVARETKR